MKTEPHTVAPTDSDTLRALDTIVIVFAVLAVTLAGVAAALI